jgi:glycosyltransferase involved in cell wall biosynthesis
LKICFIVNDSHYFISHRLSIGLALIDKGFDVYLIAPGNPPSMLIEKGFKFFSVYISRKGVNPLFDLLTLFRLYILLKKIQPDLVHLVTIKPYLYGGIAARISGVPSVVSAVAGLGILFSGLGFKNKILRFLLFPFYKFSFGHKNQMIVFQNANDHDLLIRWGVLSFNKSAFIRGSGAELKDYPFIDEPDGVPVISFASRLLKDKGVLEFVEASRILKNQGVDIRFWLIGDIDLGNSSSVTKEQLDIWQKGGFVECFGYREDIANLFAQSNIVSLPSYYGEGLPKVLVEAAACGRPVITTNHPGCRDAIEPDSGILVPVRDSVALADAIQYLVENPVKRKAMGKAGRELAEREYSIEKIVYEHIHIYNDLISKAL